MDFTLRHSGDSIYATHVNMDVTFTYEFERPNGWSKSSICGRSREHEITITLHDTSKGVLLWAMINGEPFSKEIPSDVIARVSWREFGEMLEKLQYAICECECVYLRKMNQAARIKSARKIVAN